ncbi:MAG: ROK family protein, partial [Candidatus Aenigmarchaeota archaeon]|nr:ROK family protein [Candidatus Aenigmarchaeota archaeon]
DVSRKFAWLIDVIMHVIAPAKIYIGGIAPKYGEKFLWMIREEVEKLSNFEYPSNIVEFSSMGEFAGAIGAALSSLNVIPK